ncbi:MAG TPA: hypothetical protein ENN35_07415 [Deltaproteobacteria bacterium]|nr:hypothetical protein [Deltaproteobacteria bacterium]
MTRIRLGDVAAIITIEGLLVCMECADERDLAAVASEEDLILRGDIPEDGDLRCGRCGQRIKG